MNLNAESFSRDFSAIAMSFLTREGKSKLYHIFMYIYIFYIIYTLIMAAYWYIPLESQKYPMGYHPFPNNYNRKTATQWGEI